MSCHHVCRRCAATFEPEGHEVVSLRARVAEARDEREAERAAWQGYADAWHTIEEAFDHVDHAELDAKHTPEQARDFIRAVLAERDRLREALRDALVLLENGDFANGVTHFGLDEGAMAAGHMIERLRQALWEGEP